MVLECAAGLRVAIDTRDSIRRMRSMEQARFTLEMALCSKVVGTETT